jgi:predicted dehydrogenase
MSKQDRSGMSSHSRRDFLGFVAAGAIGFPMIVRAQTVGKNAPSNRITMGIIGCGNQAEVDLKQWLPMEDVQVVAVCDVNRASHGYKTKEQFLGREPVRDSVNAAYAKRAASGTFKGCDMVTDFRDILARKDIDTVAIITPDHWHAIMTIRAAEVGKDIYCQKPLGLTVRDGQEMVRAVRKHSRILQTGSQWRSNALIRQVCNTVRNGKIGAVKRVETYVAENNFSGPGPGWKPMPVPEGFDYDAWLGPALQAPYHQDRCLYRFRFVSDYSGGQTTNFGAHSNDIAQWGLGTDDTGPVEFESLGAEYPPAGDLFDTATKVNFRCRYASGAELVCVTDKRSFGVRFEGSEGWIFTNGRTIEASSETLKNWMPGPNDLRLYESTNHYHDFIESVRSRKDPLSPVEVGHRTATICHLGNIAMKLNRKFRWDPKAEQIIGDDAASQMLQRPHRAPWKYT